MWRSSDLGHFVGLSGGVLGLSVGARAQPTFSDSSVPIRASTVSVEAWTTADGLPANPVNDIVQSPDGDLWLATAGGLVRFEVGPDVQNDRGAVGTNSCSSGTQPERLWNGIQ